MRLVLPFPPSANRYWRYNRGRIHRSKEADVFADTCHWLIRKAKQTEPLEGPVSLVATVYFPNKRGDLDNRVKQTQDVLEGMAYGDDRQVEHLEFTRAIDKANPRIEIELGEITIPQGAP